MNIAENLNTVRARLRDAALAAGRDPETIRLIAVSKTKPSAAIREALAAGQVDFGENYAQELRDKGRAFDGDVIRWHFIGHLQRNKVRYVVGRAGLVHTVDSLRLAEALAKRARGKDLIQDVLIEVNVGGEESKSGIGSDEALALAASADALEGLRVRGLMTIPPYRSSPEDVAPFFARLAELAEMGRTQGLDLVELSMGMSHDFEVAIRHGATFVRVGTAIFGRRD